MSLIASRGPNGPGARVRRLSLWKLVPGLLVAGLVLGVVAYDACKIEVPTGFQAVLARKVGLDLTKDMEIAPAPKDGRYYKGVQPGVLKEGRYFYNPFFWSWEITKQIEVPSGKLGVRISLVGEELRDGQVLAEEGQKGIRRDVYLPGRYAYNPYVETIELQDPVSIPPGFRGVVTLLTGKDPKDPNVVLVGKGERGVQRETLPPGTYPVNPYETRVSVVDCRSQRYKPTDSDKLDFLSSDGFEVKLDLAIEYRVMEDRVAEVFVLYNEDRNGDAIDEEIIAKIITPETRSICRINGSKQTGVQFIGGDTKTVFREQLMKALTANCKQQGIEILPDGVSITDIHPPQEIARPVRDREFAKQQLALFQQQKDQQESEKQLKIETMMVKRKQLVVETTREVNRLTIKSQEQQTVATTESQAKLAVARTNLEAAKDKASAVVAEAEADAEGIRFDNQAELAGLTTKVAAFGGDGGAMAQNLLVSKLAPAFRSIMTNSEGSLMDLFRQMTSPVGKPGSASAAMLPSSILPHPFTGQIAEKNPAAPAETTSLPEVKP